MAVDWSDLTLDLVCTIALKLETFEDFINFSMVCRPWNHASSLVKHEWRATPVAPWLLLAENPNENLKCQRMIFNLENNKSYKFNLPEMVGARCWGSDFGWVAMVDRDLNTQLFNPLTKARICLPSVRHLCPNADDDCFKDYEDYINWMLRFFLARLIVLKITRDEFVIMVIYDNCSHLAYSRHGDRSWTELCSTDSMIYNRLVDVATLDDNVFVLYANGVIVYWNVKQFSGCGLVKPVNYCPSRQPDIFEGLNEELHEIYLLRSGSQLLALIRLRVHVLKLNDDETEYDYDNDVVYKTIGFEVYSLNPNDRKWEEIEDFGDVALIVGNHSSMCVSAASSKNMLPGGIYFTDDETDLWSLTKDKKGHDMGVYDIKSEKISKFYECGNIGPLYYRPTFFIPQF
ncbi:hypothetical protein RND81_03G164300 [Saponaria officinalis]|uniref:KIB1-4 beta-propeller domain-containing protein n=1 Tax=Saponaria officinalis TaxID=3572 RepID=A0AAW1M887_SAPOF